MRPSKSFQKTQRIAVAAASSAFMLGTVMVTGASADASDSIDQAFRNKDFAQAYAAKLDDSSSIRALSGEVSPLCNFPLQKFDIALQIRYTDNVKKDKESFIRGEAGNWYHASSCIVNGVVERSVMDQWHRYIQRLQQEQKAKGQKIQRYTGAAPKVRMVFTSDFASDTDVLQAVGRSHPKGLKGAVELIVFKNSGNIYAVNGAKNTALKTDSASRLQLISLIKNAETYTRPDNKGAMGAAAFLPNAASAHGAQAHFEQSKVTTHIARTEKVFASGERLTIKLALTGLPHHGEMDIIREGNRFIVKRSGTHMSVAAAARFLRQQAGTSGYSFSVNPKNARLSIVQINAAPPSPASPDASAGRSSASDKAAKTFDPAQLRVPERYGPQTFAATLQSPPAMPFDAAQLRVDRPDIATPGIPQAPLLAVTQADRFVKSWDGVPAQPVSNIWGILGGALAALGAAAAAGKLLVKFAVMTNRQWNREMLEDNIRQEQMRMAAEQPDATTAEQAQPVPPVMPAAPMQQPQARPALAARVQTALSAAAQNFRRVAADMTKPKVQQPAPAAPGFISELLAKTDAALATDEPAASPLRNDPHASWARVAHKVGTNAVAQTLAGDAAPTISLAQDPKAKWARLTPQMA